MGSLLAANRAPPPPPGGEEEEEEPLESPPQNTAGAEYEQWAVRHDAAMARLEARWAARHPNLNPSPGQPLFVMDRATVAGFALLDDLFAAAAHARASP